MKKYIITESQLKLIIVKTINEQSEDRKQLKSVQQFLNAIKIQPKLVEDGLYGPSTKKAIEKYQEYLIKNGADIIVDGVWGAKTEENMPEKHKKIFEKIKNDNDDIFGRMINKISSAF